MSEDENDNCGTCAHWCAGAVASTTVPAPRASDKDVGACQVDPPPQIFIINGQAMPLQPVTHNTRTCSNWCPIDIDSEPGDEDGDGDTPPRPRPKPDVDKVRLLFPNPSKPIAA
ncbi:hypothetical protein [Sphingobium sp. CAP-1]|uniref:hypothetical protein n=1 Tax=Sphingobium sp. CAP-1 TaxID=2676077 RepID=UPI0012BB1E43|nr:hypothetical protein [Sphingobium sp. CAP-1]QGP80025.1 hypothetical protein GL174_14290 [Sphingobium sp. CAP-1]